MPNLLWKLIVCLIIIIPLIAFVFFGLNIFLWVISFCILFTVVWDFFSEYDHKLSFCCHFLRPLFIVLSVYFALIIYFQDLVTYSEGCSLVFLISSNILWASFLLNWPDKKTKLPEVFSERG